jgi:hypothetical protein
VTGIEFHEWQPLYLQAVMEPLDSADLARRIREAEMAVSRRIHELRASFDASAERQQLGYALGSLRYLRNEKFKRSNGFKSTQTGQDLSV